MPAPAPAPTPAAAPAAAGTTDVWRKLVERYKERLTPMYWFMLDDAVGVMEGDTLVVSCGDDLTLDTLDNESVSEVLRSVTGEHLGMAVRVRYTLKGAQQTVGRPAEDKLESLIRAGSKFDSFKLK